MGGGPSLFAVTASSAASGSKKEHEATGASDVSGPSVPEVTEASGVTGDQPAAESALPVEPAAAEWMTDVRSMKRTMAGELALYMKNYKPNETEKEKPADMDGKWPPNQCGLEDDEEDWEPYVAPPRIKESRLTPAERAKFKGHLDAIFSDITLLGKKMVFEPLDVAEVMEKVIPYLDSEPFLIEDVPFGVSIVGDIHGQLYDLDRVFKGDAKDGKPGWECAKYVFLGDYVDRGRQSLEVVMALFCIKMLHPDRIFLLRGNHEFLAINIRYGMVEDLFDRYDEETTVVLYRKINFAFCYLSIAAIVGNVYFCCHGGISPNGFTRRQLRGIYKPYYVSNQDSLVHDICWSDPAEGLKGTTFNKDRVSGVYFGFDALCTALESMEVVALFRAHQRIQNGVEISWNICITIFTATNYSDNNKGAVAVVDGTGKVSFRILEVDLARSQWEECLEDYELGLPLREDIECTNGIRPDDAGHGHVAKF